MGSPPQMFRFLPFFVTIFVLANVGFLPLNQYSRCQGNDVSNVTPIEHVKGKICLLMEFLRLFRVQKSSTN